MVMTPATAMMRLEFADEGFFQIDPKKIQIEEPVHTGRTYFVFKGRIIAVAQTDRRGSDVE